MWVWKGLCGKEATSSLWLTGSKWLDPRPRGFYPSPPPPTPAPAPDECARAATPCWQTCEKVRTELHCAIPELLTFRMETVSGVASVAESVLRYLQSAPQYWLQVFLKKEFTQISKKYLANIVPMSFEGQENRKILLYLNNTRLQYFLLHIRFMDLRKPFR